jgi:hypothetical protein
MRLVRGLLSKMEFVMAQNEKTSQRVAQIASKALQNPSSITQDEIQTLAASALTQSPDQQQRQKAQQVLDKLQK